ncbi:MAG: GNAT family N-acetyltransferase [Phocaeicola vulgatus]
MGDEQYHRPVFAFSVEAVHEQTQNDLFADRQLRLMIENGNRQVVGIVDLCSFDPLHNRAEVGIMVDKSCRRQGIGRNRPGCWKNTVSLSREFISCLPISLLKAFSADSLRRAVQREVRIERVGAYVWRWLYGCAGCPKLNLS